MGGTYHYTIATELPDRLVSELQSVPSEPFLWLVEGSSYNALPEMIEKTARAYHSASPAVVVAHIRRRDLGAPNGTTPSTAPFKFIADCARRLNSDAASPQRNPLWNDVLGLFEATDDVRSLGEAIDAEVAACGGELPLLCISDYARSMHEGAPHASSLARIIAASHADGMKCISRCRIVLGFCAWREEDVHKFVYRLGSPRPTRHYVAVSGTVPHSVGARRNITEAVAALSDGARRTIAEIAPGRTVPFHYSRHHELLVQGLLSAANCKDGVVERVSMATDVAEATAKLDSGRQSRGLWLPSMRECSVACYVDIDNVGTGAASAAWVQKVVGAVQAIQADSSPLLFKCWFTCVANSATVKSAWTQRFITSLHDQAETNGLFAKDDLDRVELRVVPSGREAADTAILWLLRYDGFTTHKVVVTADHKLVASLLWSRSSCAESLVVITKQSTADSVASLVRDVGATVMVVG